MASELAATGSDNGAGSNVVSTTWPGDGGTLSRCRSTSVQRLQEGGVRDKSKSDDKAMTYPNVPSYSARLSAAPLQGEVLTEVPCFPPSAWFSGMTFENLTYHKRGGGGL